MNEQTKAINEPISGQATKYKPIANTEHKHRQRTTRQHKESEQHIKGHDGRQRHRTEQHRTPQKTTGDHGGPQETRGSTRMWRGWLMTKPFSLNKNHHPTVFNVQITKRTGKLRRIFWSLDAYCLKGKNIIDEICMRTASGTRFWENLHLLC